MDDMKWKLLFGVLFILSVTMTFLYSNKSMVIYNKTAVESVPASTGGSVFEERVTRTYQENYSSIGGAIGFGIIAAAAVLAFATIVNKDKNIEQ